MKSKQYLSGFWAEIIFYSGQVVAKAIIETIVVKYRDYKNSWHYVYTNVSPK